MTYSTISSKKRNVKEKAQPQFIFLWKFRQNGGVIYYDLPSSRGTLPRQLSA